MSRASGQIGPMAASFTEWHSSKTQRERREETLRWGLSFMSVLVATAGVTAWITSAPHPVTPVAAAPAAAIAIDMVPAPVPAATSRQDVPMPPQHVRPVPVPTPVEPPKITAPPSPTPSPPVPVPKPEKLYKIVKKHKAVPNLKKTSPENSQQIDAAAASLPSAATPASSPQAAPVSGVSSPNAAHDPVTWQGALLAQLEKFKRYPQTAMAEHEEGVPTVTFSMDRAGHVLSVRLSKSSGHPLLDAEALALPKRAQPLPAPPESVPGEPITLTVPVEFDIH
ncbi:energy transducer TonB [Acetobacter persici]|uniref:energy transducer TonB n=1 Tax=Acetobacter persici TaxID=1076596 RepID=UPI001FD433B2|nr:energy transducer TonB [Acetobacter persici]